MDQMFHKEDSMGERQPRYSKEEFYRMFPFRASLVLLDDACQSSPSMIDHTR